MRGRYGCRLIPLRFGYIAVIHLILLVAIRSAGLAQADLLVLLTPSCGSQAMPSACRGPCRGARSCSSRSSPSPRTSFLRTRSMSPNLVMSASAIISLVQWDERETGKNLPKTVGPRLATSFPSVLPWKRTGSWPGPALYAKVQTACALLSSKPSSMW